MSHRYHPHPEDKQTPGTGKSANDTNKQGEQTPTQKHEGRRTVESRHDREAQIGNNQSKMRGGSPQGDNMGSPKNGGGRL